MSPFVPAMRLNKTNCLFLSATNFLFSNSIPVRVAVAPLVVVVSSPEFTAHSRVYASNESRGSVSGWAPSAALRPATDAEIATRVSGVSTAYVANAGSSPSPAPPASPPDDDLDNGPTQYSNGVSHLKFPSAESLPAEALPDVVRPVARVASATRINRVMEAAEQQYGIRPRGTISGASSSFVDPYATVGADIAENLDRAAAAQQQREGVATGYGMQRPPAAAAAAPQVEGVARGYSSGAAGTPPPGPTGYTRPGVHTQQNLRAQQHGAPTEQYGQLQLIPRENEQAAPDPTLFY